MVERVPIGGETGFRRDAEIVLKIVAQASLPVDDARSATKPLPDRSDGQLSRATR